MKTVKVRVAVAVGPDGGWNCCGWSAEKTGEDEMMGLACEIVTHGEARYWLEAELAIPETSTVAATVLEVK